MHSQPLLYIWGAGHVCAGRTRFHRLARRGEAVGLRWRLTAAGCRCSGGRRRLGGCWSAAVAAVGRSLALPEAREAGDGPPQVGADARRPAAGTCAGLYAMFALLLSYI